MLKIVFSQGMLKIKRPNMIFVISNRVHHMDIRVGFRNPLIDEVDSDFGIKFTNNFNVSF
jgi:hypothetical protein